jgi:hypothetical protein
MKLVEEKYVINVDFPTESIIHVNPLLHQIDPRCQTGLKKSEDGGLILATEEEVSNYLDGTISVLAFHGKKVTNLRRCKICQTKEAEHET